MHTPSALSDLAGGMEIVKNALDFAHAGPKKAAALKFYQAARKARFAKKDEDCARALDAAKHALV